MSHRVRRSAFTLIELLTVMAIITLLIGILTPSLSTARDQAKKTAVRAQINAMEVGLEAFRGDEGQYVPSNPALYASDLLAPGAEMLDWEVGTTAAPLQGANLLLDALVGRDFLGYDPKAPPFGPGGANPVQYDRWLSTNDRRLPYVPADGVDVTSKDKPPTDAFGGNPNLVNGVGPTQPEIQGSGTDILLCRVFRDKFGWPILYYRANPSANANTSIISDTDLPAGEYVGNGVYDGVDNEFFTSYDAPPNPAHRIYDADQPLTVPVLGNPVALDNRFAEFIRSLRSTTYDNIVTNGIVHPRPVKFGRFIILSPGKDGIFGSLDDVGNFAVFSEER